MANNRWQQQQQPQYGNQQSRNQNQPPPPQQRANHHQHANTWVNNGQQQQPHHQHFNTFNGNMNGMGMNGMPPMNGMNGMNNMGMNGMPMDPMFGMGMNMPMMPNMFDMNMMMMSASMTNMNDMNMAMGMNGMPPLNNAMPAMNGMPPPNPMQNAQPPKPPQSNNANSFNPAFAPPPAPKPPQPPQPSKKPPPNPMQGGGFGSSAPLPPAMNNMNPMQGAMNPMQALQAMGRQGSFRNPVAMGANANPFGTGFAQQQQPPPPPNANGNAQYQYDQNLQGANNKGKRERRKKRKKKKDNLGPEVGGGYGGLSAPRPRRASRQKVSGGRIRNSFLMTNRQSSNQMRPQGQIGFKGQAQGQGQSGNTLSMPSLNESASSSNKKKMDTGYVERGKKKVSYSKKETEKMRVKLLSADKSMKKLRDIKDGKKSGKDRHKLVMKKIHLCKYVCDFNQVPSEMVTLDAKEKARIENKQALLVELSQYFETSQWHKHMDTKELSKFIESLLKMVSHNLFRVLPDPLLKEVVKTDTSGKDAKISITKELPSWRHLGEIYKILEAVLSRLAKEGSGAEKDVVISQLANFNVVSNVVYLLNTEETREEEAVMKLIHILYHEYPRTRLFVLGQLSNVCYSYLYIDNRVDFQVGKTLREKNKNQTEQNKSLAVGVKTVLTIFRDCLDSAEEDEMDGWVELLCQVIIPLHKAPVDEFTLFDDALSKISVTFCEKYFLSFIYIFNGLLRYWPVTSSKKEQLFLRRVGPILDKADEDCWEFKDKSQCEFRDVFGKLAHKICDAVSAYEYTHYATAERVVDMFMDDEVQRFVDIYGGKECYLKLYKGLYDLSTKFFWKETVDKVKELIEEFQEEADIPMQYVDDFEAIEKGSSSSESERVKMERKRKERRKYFEFLEQKHRSKSVATYQKVVYKNNQPMLRLQAAQQHHPGGSINFSSDAMAELTGSMSPQMRTGQIKGYGAAVDTKKTKVAGRWPPKKKKKKDKKVKGGNVGLPPPPPKQMWDDDDF